MEIFIDRDGFCHALLTLGHLGKNHAENVTNVALVFLDFSIGKRKS